MINSFDWLINKLLIDQLVSLMDQSIDWMTDCDWLIDPLIDWLIAWLIDWFID